MKIKRADIERILILCAAALVVVLALRSNDQTTSQVLVEQTAIPIEQTLAQEDTVSTVVFYEDGDGYLVPVTRQVPNDRRHRQGHACADGQGCGNDMQAARLGLRTVIPEGTTFEYRHQTKDAPTSTSARKRSTASTPAGKPDGGRITNALTCFSDRWSEVTRRSLTAEKRRQAHLRHRCERRLYRRQPEPGKRGDLLRRCGAGATLLPLADGAAAGARDARGIQRR